MLQTYQTILAAVDGSKESRIAFEKAVNVAKRNDGLLILAHVVDTRAFQTVSVYENVAIEQSQEMAQKTLDELKAEAEKNGVANVQTIVEYGNPKSMLGTTIPKNSKVDLILLGATGLNAVERLFVGSVSEYVIRHAPCDVLIVRTELDNQTKIETD
ncbi:MAG: universal stress protein [Streptococcaceae bacterium]|nr:universal stress protein [Streptococcaceae bacterium]